jgi:hypothetical protein
MALPSGLTSTFIQVPSSTSTFTDRVFKGGSATFHLSFFSSSSCAMAVVESKKSERTAMPLTIKELQG